MRVGQQPLGRMDVEWESGSAPGTDRWKDPAGFTEVDVFPPSRYKTVLCRNFASHGLCQFDVFCEYAHGEYELRTDLSHSSLYKTQPCRFFLRGRCKNGSKCRWAHGVHELRSTLVTADARLPVAAPRPASRLPVFVEVSLKSKEEETSEEEVSDDDLEASEPEELGSRSGSNTSVALTEADQLFFASLSEGWHGSGPYNGSDTPFGDLGEDIDIDNAVLLTSTNPARCEACCMGYERNSWNVCCLRPCGHEFHIYCVARLLAQNAARVGISKDSEDNDDSGGQVTVLPNGVRLSFDGFKCPLCRRRVGRRYLSILHRLIREAQMEAAVIIHRVLLKHKSPLMKDMLAAALYSPHQLPRTFGSMPSTSPFASNVQRARSTMNVSAPTSYSASETWWDYSGASPWPSSDSSTQRESLSSGGGPTRVTGPYIPSLGPRLPQAVVVSGMSLLGLPSGGPKPFLADQKVQSRPAPHRPPALLDYCVGSGVMQIPRSLSMPGLAFLPEQQFVLSAAVEPVSMPVSLTPPYAVAQSSPLNGQQQHGFF